jgi:hypothetical protein
MDGQEHAYHLQQAESGHSSLGRYNGRGHELVLLPSAGVITSRQSLLLLPDFFFKKYARPSQERPGAGTFICLTCVCLAGTRPTWGPGALARSI